MGVISTAGLVILSITGFFLSKSWVRPLSTSYNILKQFTEDVTHELKTPIATIEACVDNLEEDCKGEDRFKPRLEAIKRSTGRMNKLVEDLTLLIQLGAPAQGRSASFESVSINNLIEQVVDDFELRFQEKQIKIETDLEKEIYIKGEENKLRRLLDNIMENSLRYTDSGGTIKVKTRTRSSNLVLEVSDEGIGIPEQSLNQIFNRFYRVDTARSRAQGGVGLGLSIVKGLVELHQGDITIKSKLGEGTTICISLPTGQSPA